MAKGYREATADATVTRCRELGWVNDPVFALDRARQLRCRGAGPLRIGGDLEARGVPGRVIDAAVIESRDGRSETDLAREAIGRVPADRAARARAWRLLVAHGFPEDAVADVLGDD